MKPGIPFAVGLLAFAAVFSWPAAAMPALEAGFAAPPAAARPWVYWIWGNGNITKEGIRADLEDMRRVGIGGAMLFDGSLNLPDGPVRYGTDAWHEHLRYTLATAQELGLKIVLMNCAGWATSGGPWVDADHSMKLLGWSQQAIDGGARWHGTLPAPRANLDYYRDVAVLAVPRVAQPFRVADLARKSGLRAEAPTPRAADWSDAPGEFASTDVIDLTAQLGPHGELDWAAPAGDWTVLRFGYTTTARTNHPAPPEGEGLEVDKLDATAVAAHLEHALGRVLRESPAIPGATGGLAGILSDSWEAGPQTWTAALPAEFRARCGYDLRAFLPALAGHIIGTTGETEAFLADYRRTLGELYAENHYGTLQRFAHAHDSALFAEAYGGVFDEARALEHVDFPMVEFWLHGLYKGFDHVPSVAHLTGRPLVLAEAFTGRSPRAHWTEYPLSLKTLGDAAFAAGVNSLVLHSYVHQPRSDLAPGFTHGRYGTHFGRLNAWWPLAPGWIDYLRRAQFLLQQGHAVADLLVLDPDRLQSESRELPATVVVGHRSDLLPVSLLAGLTVRNGRLCAPGGTEYRVLVLPDAWVTGVATLRQLQRLLNAGATLVGPPPLAPDDLPDARERRVEWQALVNQLWTPTGPERRVERFTAADALAGLGVEPDFIAHANAPVDVRFFHRSGEGFDLYFISNQEGVPHPTEATFRYDAPGPVGSPVTVELVFRITGLVPEVWDAVTGLHASVPAYTSDASGTRFRLTLAAAESVFIVFRAPRPAVWPIALVQPDGRPIALTLPELLAHAAPLATVGGYCQLSDGTRHALPTSPPPASLTLAGPWTVTFTAPAGGRPPTPLVIGTLASWTTQADPAVRFFSGTATYETRFIAAASTGSRVLLDLGDVRDLARVTLNGRSLGLLWQPPFVADATAALRDGENVLQVVVANRWVNRLVGDEQLAADTVYVTKGPAAGSLAALPAWWSDPAALARRERQTFATWRHFTTSSPLLPAGLLGPVQLRFAHSFDLAP